MLKELVKKWQEQNRCFSMIEEKQNSTNIKQILQNFNDLEASFLNMDEIIFILQSALCFGIKIKQIGKFAAINYPDATGDLIKSILNSPLSVRVKARAYLLIDYLDQKNRRKSVLSIEEDKIRTGIITAFSTRRKMLDWLRAYMDETRQEGHFANAEKINQVISEFTFSF